MGAEPARKLGPQLLPDGGAKWEPYEPYQRIEPGEYLATCSRVRTYWDRRFQRHVCLLVFDIHGEFASSIKARLPLFLNLGGDKDRIKPGRCSLYFAAWVAANGGLPRRHDRMVPMIFKGRVARVEVVDTTRMVRVDFSENRPIYRQVPTENPYSTVKRIISWETESAVLMSTSQRRHVLNGAVRKA